MGKERVNGSSPFEGFTKFFALDGFSSLIRAPPSVALGRTALAALNRGRETENQRTQSWSRHAPVIPDPPESQQYL
jgi:hypothetical protein